MGEGAKRVTTGEGIAKRTCANCGPCITHDREEGGEARLAGSYRVLRNRRACITQLTMKTITVRLPDALACEIEAELRVRRISKSDVVRERLQRAPTQSQPDPLASIRDLIGSVKDDLPADLSARTDHYLQVTGFGRDTTR